MGKAGGGAFGEGRGALPNGLVVEHMIQATRERGKGKAELLVSELVRAREVRKEKRKES